MKLYGLIGEKLTHSFSHNYFTEKFLKENISGCSYSLFVLSNISELSKLIKDNPNLAGLNVTIPYKTEVFPFLNEISEEAKAIGAVNTIKINRSTNSLQLIGYNTDVEGFEFSLLKNISTKNLKALVLGTGGASRAVCYVLKKHNIPFQLVSRNKTEDTLLYSELSKEIIHKHKLLINTTPLGMFPEINSLPPIPYQHLTSEHILFDLVYNPAETVFLKQGKLKNCKIINGLDMLYTQAEEAWKIWNNRPIKHQLNKDL